MSFSQCNTQDHTQTHRVISGGSHDGIYREKSPISTSTEKHHTAVLRCWFVGGTTVIFCTQEINRPVLRLNWNLTHYKHLCLSRDSNFSRIRTLCLVVSTLTTRQADELIRQERTTVFDYARFYTVSGVTLHMYLVLKCGGEHIERSQLWIAPEKSPSFQNYNVSLIL